MSWTVEYDCEISIIRSTYVGQVTEDEFKVDSGGRVTVHKVYNAIDCGRAINPDIIRAQTEGCVVFGLSAALTGEVKIENGRTTQSNFHDCPILTLKEAPHVETEIIQSGAAIGASASWQCRLSSRP